jgi:hypothetical protein
VPNLESIAIRLAEAKVEFVLCGGLAATLQGSSIFTRVVDVVCVMDPDNIARLYEAVRDLHPYHRMTPGRIPFALEQTTVQPLQNIYLSTDWGQLDCLGHVKGIGGYGECLKFSEPIEMAGFTMMTLTLEGILIAKRAMGRPRDLQTVFELEAVREKKHRRPIS